mgnify:FL=1
MSIIQTVRPYFTCQYVPTPMWQKVYDGQQRSYDWRGMADDDAERKHATDRLGEAWDLDNVEYYAPLGALVLKMAHTKRSVEPSHYKKLLAESVTSDKWRLERPVRGSSADYLKYYDTRPDKRGEVLFDGLGIDLDPGIVIYIARAVPSTTVVAETKPGTYNIIDMDEGALQPYIWIGLPEIVTWRYEKDENGNTIAIPESAIRYAYAIPTVRPDKKDDHRGIALVRQTLTANPEYPGEPEEGFIIDPWCVSDSRVLRTYGDNAVGKVLKYLDTQGTVVFDPVIIRFLGGKLMFTSGSTDADFVWEDDTLRELWANNNTIASHGATSCLRISIQAHQAMVLPCQGTVMRNGEGFTGTVTKRTPPAIPNECSLVKPDGSINLTVSAIGTQGERRDGATLTPIVSFDDGEHPTRIVSLGVTLEAKNPARTPILYVVRTQYDPIFSTSSPLPVNLNVRRISISRSESLEGHVRGSSCSVVLDAFDQTVPIFHGNEEFAIQAGLCRYVDGLRETTDPYAIFGGRLFTPTYEEAGKIIESAELQLYDYGFVLMNKKFCRDEIGSVAEMSWLEAAAHSFNAFGVSNNRLFVNGHNITTPEALFYDVELPEISETQTDRSLEASYDAPAAQWLDFLVALNPGWTWRIEPDLVHGWIVNIVPMPEYWGGAVIHVMRENPDDPNERIYRVEHPLTLEEYVNYVEVLNTSGVAVSNADKESELEHDENISAYWHDVDSVNDPNYRYYIGEKWYSQVKEREGFSPEAHAYVEGVRSRHKRDIVVWETKGQNLFAGEIVESRIGNLDWLPTGTLLKIRNEERDLEATGDEVKHTVRYQCQVLKWGDGTVPPE